MKCFQLPERNERSDGPNPALVSAWILLVNNDLQWPHMSQLFQCTQDTSWDDYLEPLLRSPLHRPVFIFDPDRLPGPALQELSALS